MPDIDLVIASNNNLQREVWEHLPRYPLGSELYHIVSDFNISTIKRTNVFIDLALRGQFKSENPSLPTDIIVIQYDLGSSRAGKEREIGASLELVSEIKSSYPSVMVAVDSRNGGKADLLKQGVSIVFDNESMDSKLSALYGLYTKFKSESL